VTTVGTLTIASGATIAAGGGFTKSGAGSTSLSGNINTSAGNGNITFNSSVTLGASVQLNSGAGTTSFLGGTSVITLGGYTLTINSVVFASGVSLAVVFDGSGPDSKIIVSSGTATLNGNTLSGTVNGVSTGDAFTLFDNQSGNIVTGQFAGGNTVTIGGQAFSVNYAALGNDSIVLTAAAVENVVSGPVTDPMDPTKTAVVVVGLTTGNNVIQITRLDTVNFDILLNGTNYLRLLPSGHIYVQGGSGNDVIEVTTTLGTPLFIRAGAGDDYIVGGTAADIILGEDGDDIIYGGQNRDLLIGGAGNDVIYGGGVNLPDTAAGDLIIGVSTIYDAIDQSLIAISQEWARTNATLTQRVQNLSRGTGGLPVVNGTIMINDLARNQFVGYSSQDWIWGSSLDYVRNRDDFRRLPVYRFFDPTPVEVVEVGTFVAQNTLANLSGLTTSTPSVGPAVFTAPTGSSPSSAFSLFNSPVATPSAGPETTPSVQITPTRGYREAGVQAATKESSSKDSRGGSEASIFGKTVQAIVDLLPALFESLKPAAGDKPAADIADEALPQKSIDPAPAKGEGESPSNPGPSQ
jgi:hypothetical protein